MDDADGEWTALANWNSGQTPIAPVQGPGQVPRAGSLTLPAVRLPSVDDTVILDRPGADVTVTLSSGTHNIRKLYVREEFDMLGGALTVGYVPSADSTPESAVFSAPVVLGDAASLSVHTLLVDAEQDFTVDGTLTFSYLDLARHSTAPAAMLAGDIALNPLANSAAFIGSTLGTGSAGSIDLGGQPRTWQVGNGFAPVDVTVDLPVTNGSLVKAGPGTLKLTAATEIQGDVTVNEGTLILEDLSIDDSAKVMINIGSKLQLDFLGEPDLVNAFIIDGFTMPAGVWGGPGSGAEFVHPTLAGTGKLLVVAPLLEGDFNQDGLVDLTDYSIWRENIGREAGTLPNDDSGEPIGNTQYLAWKSNFSTPLAASAAAAAMAPVPEPASATAVLLLLGVVRAAIRRR
jgi:autotransporter-associated beta strand protein